MASKKPKLPKVWVVFNVAGRPFISALTPPSVGAKIAERHRYAPVQKPRTCVWTATFTEGDGYYAVGCLIRTYRQFGGSTFCPDCGSKIKVAR